MLTYISPSQLADVLDVVEDGIITVNARQEIVLYNGGAAKLFGYARGEVLGRPIEVLIPARYHPAHGDLVSNFASGPNLSRTMADRLTVYGRRKDGTEFPVEISISKLNAGGEVLLTAIVRDAAARKRYEDALVRLNHDLEERVRVRTLELAERNLQLTQKTEENEMFVYSVSHDLRSPLVNLEGFSEELQTAAGEIGKLLADERIPPDVRACAEALFRTDVAEPIGFIRTAVGRLGRIIDALLRLSRAGRAVYQPQTIDMAAAARRVVEALRRTIGDRRAEVVVGDLPPAWADPGAAEQVFANLIGNALNYLDPARPGKIQVGAQPPDPADPETRVYYVRDNGMGIPAAYHGKLFQALQRLHPDKSPGEGIGLVMVRRMLERLGGTIRFESEAGVGSTFYFTLPAAGAREGAVGSPGTGHDRHP